ncbi:MAG: hypothetical protein ABI488_05635 [Polyangiaceae bacterium]
MRRAERAISAREGRAAGDSAQFRTPTGIAANSLGELFVVDTGAALIRKISPDGVVSTFCGDRSKPGAPHFSTPIGIAIDALDVVYASDTNGHRIVAITPDGNSIQFAGSGRGNLDSASAYQARFDMPHGLAISPLGGLYVADFGTARSAASAQKASPPSRRTALARARSRSPRTAVCITSPRGTAASCASRPPVRKPSS